MAKPIFVLNGPNLDRLGNRGMEVAGASSLDDVATLCCRAAEPKEIVFRQTNREDELVAWVHEACDAASGIVLSATAHAFTSQALAASLKMFSGPVVEVHLGDTHKAAHPRSLLAPVVTATVSGLGIHGYELAVDAACRDLAVA